MTVREREAAEREARLDFKVAVLAVDRGCVVHKDPADCEGDIEIHHGVSQQQLRHAGRDDLRWSPRNGMAACSLAHRRHTLATERIAYERLPQRCIDFAAEYGFTWLLDRYYPRRSTL